MKKSLKLMGEILLKRLPLLLLMVLVAFFMRYFFNQKNESLEMQPQQSKKAVQITAPPLDTLKTAKEETKISLESLHDSAFVELVQLDKDFILDIRYATENNFMKKKVYPCAKALLRKKTALALLKAHNELKEMGYFIKIYDAYRPRDVQWILWNSTDKKQYVADPKKGSNHNRGCAVDLTLVYASDLKEVEMGTTYDFFGKEAHHAYTNLPKKVLENRLLLKNTLVKYNFRPVSHEWWHYDFAIKYPLSNYPLPCD